MRLFLAIVALAFVPAALSAADTDVIQPRTSQAGETGTGRAPSQPSWPMAAALGLCAAAGGVVWYRRRAPGVTGPRSIKQLSIAESRALGNRQHLVVADYAGQKFLLGVCPGRIDLLSKLEEPETDDES